ncbi:nuclear transport factor 2 family protein [Streptomyces sp. NPDC002490]|uniref:nuclear transport factor 2 family protein n=1 Tax=Streptomyces sp. NPDC002490 TaxID=3154416 RepID=UPI0033298225
MRSLLVATAAATLLSLGPGAAHASAPESACPAVTAAGTAREAPLPADAERFLRAYCAWGEDTSDIEAYMNLFAEGGTLMDSGLDRPLTAVAIRAQITRVTQVVDRYRFVPVDAHASADGRVLFVKARNTGYVGPSRTRIDYVTTHRLVLRGALVAEGRRFWDQSELFRPLEPTLPDLFAGFDTAPTTARGPRHGRPLSPGERARAWNTRDAHRLVDDVRGPLRLTGPGLTAPLTGRAEARAYLERFFSRVHRLDLAPGETVHRGGATYREWVGTARVSPDGSEPVPMTYGIVERFSRNATGGTDWNLAFETLDLVATQDRIRALRGRIFG